MSSFLDRILYINLDRRKDRQIEIENELKMYDLFDKSERIVAVDRPEKGKGIVGCTCSHLNALKLAKQRGYKYVLILEDDFQFVLSKEEVEMELSQLFSMNESFEVCMISYNLKQGIPYNEFLTRVIEAQTASGYIVHESFYDKLIELYEWAIPLLDETMQHWIYANDQIWKRLQPTAKWLCFNRRLGIQRASYSDNSENFEDYGL